MSNMQQHEWEALGPDGHRKIIAESFTRAARTPEEALEDARKMMEEFKKRPGYRPAPLFKEP